MANRDWRPQHCACRYDPRSWRRQSDRAPLSRARQLAAVGADTSRRLGSAPLGDALRPCTAGVPTAGYPLMGDSRLSASYAGCLLSGPLLTLLRLTCCGSSQPIAAADAVAIHVSVDGRTMVPDYSLNGFDWALLTPEDGFAAVRR